MSNSFAQPVLRTTELSEALRVVERLLEIADTGELEVDFEAVVTAAPALTGLSGVCPGAEWWAEGAREGSSEAGDDPLTCLPVRIRAWALPPETVPALLQAAAGSPATVRWDFSGWPPAPEVGLDACGTRGAFITLCLNVRDLELAEPAPDHTVFVHVKQTEAERAPWLAAEAGLRVIGDLVMAPY